MSDEKHEDEWVTMDATAVNVNLVGEVFVRIPWADDYEFIGPMPPELGGIILADHAAARDRRQLEERVHELEAALREIMDNTSPAAVEKASTQTVFLAIDIHQCAAEALLSPQESSGTEGEGK